MLVLKLIILSVVLVGIGMAGMGISILLKKNGKFPEHKVGHNSEMRKRKIYCIKTQIKMEEKQYIKLQKLKLQNQMGDDEDLLVFNNIDEPDLNHLSLFSN